MLGRHISAKAPGPVPRSSGTGAAIGYVIVRRHEYEPWGLLWRGGGACQASPNSCPPLGPGPQGPRYSLKKPWALQGKKSHRYVVPWRLTKRVRRRRGGAGELWDPTVHKVTNRMDTMFLRRYSTSSGTVEMCLQHNASSGTRVRCLQHDASSGTHDLFLQLKASSRIWGDFPTAIC